MKNSKDISLDEKIKALSISQQLYIKGLIDGALLHKEQQDTTQSQESTA